MTESKQELEKAILKLAETINVREQVTILMLHNLGIHSTIKEITFIMFTNNYSHYFEKDDVIFDSVSLVRKYCKEVQENGEVKFDVPYNPTKQ